MSIKQDIKDIDKAVDKIVDDINTEGKIEDEEATELVDMLQRIEDKLTTTFAQYGIEIGDERVD